MKRRKRQSRLYVIFLIILVSSIVLSSIYIREGDSGPLHSIEAYFRDLLMVPINAARAAYGNFSDWAGGVLQAGELKRENELLRREIQEARRLILEAEDIKRENERLRELLDLKSRFSYQSIPAEIIFVHRELSGNFYTINRGKVDGIEKNMPVVTPSGLFGKVYSVGNKSSVVIPINHPFSSVAARIVETGENGIIEGSRDGKLYLKLISKESTATIGMLVTTSGLGGVYPKGLLIGSITEIKSNPNKLDLEITVGPASNFDREEFLLVLLPEEK